MGSRLARRLLAAGHRSSAGTARPTRRATSSRRPHPRQVAAAAAEGVEAVFTMVTDDAALRAVGLDPTA